MLCQHICRVLGAKHFVQSKVASGEFVLHPQVGSGEVPNLAKAPPPAHAYGRCGVRMDLKHEVQTKVFAQ